MTLVYYPTAEKKAQKLFSLIAIFCNHFVVGTFGCALSSLPLNLKLFRNFHQQIAIYSKPEAHNELYSFFGVFALVKWEQFKVLNKINFNTHTQANNESFQQGKLLPKKKVLTTKTFQRNIHKHTKKLQPNVVHCILE